MKRSVGLMSRWSSFSQILMGVSCLRITLKVQVVNQIMQETSALGGDTNRLLALSILNLTQEEIVKLKETDC